MSVFNCRRRASAGSSSLQASGTDEHAIEIHEAGRRDPAAGRARIAHGMRLEQRLTRLASQRQILQGCSPRRLADRVALAGYCVGGPSLIVAGALSLATPGLAAPLFLGGGALLLVGAARAAIQCAEAGREDGPRAPPATGLASYAQWRDETLSRLDSQIPQVQTELAQVRPQAIQSAVDDWLPAALTDIVLAYQAEPAAGDRAGAPA